MRRLIRLLSRADDVLELVVVSAFRRLRARGPAAPILLALPLVILTVTSSPLRPPDDDAARLLLGHIWMDRIPPDENEQHQYYFFGSPQDARGVYLSRMRGSEKREHFRWSLTDGRLNIRFDRDGRRATTPIVLERREGDGFDCVLTLRKDPCRKDTRQTYLRKKKG